MNSTLEDSFTTPYSDDNATWSNETEGFEEETSPDWVPLDTFIGLILAFSSCLLIGISVIYKKLALKDLEARGGTRAVDGGFGYLRIPKWWLGITLMALGELTNFVAYMFAPAILVTPLGVFSIVCTAALSPYFLKERLNIVGKLGCILVIVGCVIVTLCGPKDKEVASMEDLQSQLLNAGFLIYASLVVGVSAILMALVPKFGHKYVMLYITICSSFGSLSVMFCKGVGLALKETIGGNNEFTNWATWVCVVSLIICLLVETVFMQRALDIFNSSVFMSINYVMFTSLVIVASSILYTELRELGWKNIVLTILGFIVNIVALYLLHIDKNVSLSKIQCSEDPLPEREQETPLMNKEEDNVAEVSTVKNSKNFLQSGPLQTTMTESPLASVRLTPSLLKGNQYISFNDRSCTNSVKHSKETISENSSLTCDDDDQSNISEEKQYSLSDSSDSISLVGIAEDPPSNESTDCQSDKLNTVISNSPREMREFPLISELHNSHARISNHDVVVIPKTLSGPQSPKDNSSMIVEAEKSVNEVYRIMNENVSEDGEIIRLV